MIGFILLLSGVVMVFLGTEYDSPRELSNPIIEVEWEEVEPVEQKEVTSYDSTGNAIESISSPEPVSRWY